MQTNAVALHFMQYETKYVLTFIKNTLVNIIYTQERRGQEHYILHHLHIVFFGIASALRNGSWSAAVLWHLPMQKRLSMGHPIQSPSMSMGRRPEFHKIILYSPRVTYLTTVLSILFRFAVYSSCSMFCNGSPLHQKMLNVNLGFEQHHHQAVDHWGEYHFLQHHWLLQNESSRVYPSFGVEQNPYF